jgi:hypothetical protein
MRQDDLHELVHKEPLAAWPHVVSLIEAGQESDEQTLLVSDEQTLLVEDLVYSNALPALIDQIEEQAGRSKRFRFALLNAAASLGGRGGPEMDRIWKLIDAAEAELATVIEFDDESELQSSRALRETMKAAPHNKMLIIRRRARQSGGG